MNCRPVAGILGLISNILILWALISPRWSTSLPLTTSGQPIRVGFWNLVDTGPSCQRFLVFLSPGLGLAAFNSPSLKIENLPKYHGISRSMETVLRPRWHRGWFQHRMQQIYSGNSRISPIWIGGSTSFSLFVFYFLFLRSHFWNGFDRGREFGQIKKVKK